MAVALPFIALGSSVAGAIGSGVASANAANYQAQVARNNAVTAQQNARYSAAAGSSDIQQEGLKVREQGAEVKAGIAANNLDVNTGSAADVQQSQRELGALDTATVANRAAEQVYGYQTQATGYAAQANLDAAQAPYDIAGGILKGVGSVASAVPNLPGGASLLNGASSVPDNYSWMSAPGNQDPSANGVF